MRKAVLMLALVLVALSAQAAAFKVVANSSVKVDSLSRNEAADIFMKRVSKLPNGTTVVPVDQLDRSPVRGEFSRVVHGKPAAAVKSYWNQQIFAGRDIPPVEKASDADVLAFVRSTAGAVGYVSDSTPVEGVRVISVQ